MDTLEQLCERLVNSSLMTADEVDQHLADWRGEADTADDSTEAFADWLVAKERLTEFQGDALLAGHTGPFQLGPYRVEEQLAAGRLGGVFRAVHEDFDQPVSLKVYPSALSTDPEKHARMGRELRVAVELDHPNVVRSYQLGRVGDAYYLAMEALQGETLEAKLEVEGSLPYKEACRIGRDVARGLAHLHENDVIHRDLRPANIWIADNGAAKLMEFGAARDAYSFLDAAGHGGDELTTHDSVLGEYDYMAAEQAKDARDADTRSDIYALGCTLYHCLAGHPPFTDKNPAKLVLKHASDQPRAISEAVAGAPHQLDEVMDSLLAKDPDERYQNAGDVAFALAAFVDDQSESAPDVGTTVSEAYLQWAQESHPAPQRMSQDAVAVTPELTSFLDWMARKQSRKKRKK